MIYIIRHGQTVLNKAKALQGRSDHPLNDDGIAEAEKAGQWFKEHGITFARVWSSPMVRAVQTAEIVSGDTLPVQTDDRLMEMEYGPYEGVSLDAPPPEIITFFSDFVRNPAPKGMEQLSEVVKRAGSFMEDLKASAPEGNILISTHAILMKGVLEYLTPESNGSYWSKYLGNCAVYAVEIVQGSYTVPVETDMMIQQKLN